LHCPISFHAPQYSVTFSARLLQAPVVRNELDLAGFLSVAPYHLVIKPAVSDTSVSVRIQELLGRDLLEPPDFEALTRMLNMSARTLRRRLEKEGSSYQRLKDNTRRDAAISLLSRTRLPIAEIAARVGFSDPSAFHRSFKKWTGLAPGEYR
jgi:AraC-like DNA-binding protein